MINELKSITGYSKEISEESNTQFQMQKSTTTPNHKVEKQSTCQSYSQNIIGVSSGDTTTNNLDPELSLITDKFKQINEEKEKLETGLDDVLAGLTNELDAFMLDSTGPSKPTPTKSTTPVSPKRRVTPKPNISPSFTSKSDTHIEEVDSGFTCTFCNESIIGKWIKIAPEKIYHPLHFKCESKKTKLAGNGICGKVLNESNYKNKDGINHCLSCYNDASAAKCDYCNLSIKDVVKCIQVLWIIDRIVWMHWVNRFMHTISFVHNVENCLNLKES